MKKQHKNLLCLIMVLGSLTPVAALGAACNSAKIEVFPAEYHGKGESAELQYLAKKPLGLAVEKFRLEPAAKEAYVSLTEQSSKDLRTLTGTYLEKRLVIIANGKVVSSPQIKAPMEKREFVISFDQQSDFEQLASALNATNACKN